MILDTNALSALAESDAALLRKLEPLPRLFLNIISLGKYQCGIDGSRMKSELDHWLSSLMSQCEILSPKPQTISVYSEIRHQLKRDGTPIPANDVWIAALNKQTGLPLVSRDTHFDFVEGMQRSSL